MQEYNHNQQYHCLGDGGGGVVFGKDGADADDAGADDCSNQVSDASKYDCHEGVDDIALPDSRVNGTEKSYGASCDTCKSRAHCESQVVHLAGVDAHALCHGTVLHDGSHLATEIGLVHHKPNGAHAKSYQQDDENSVIGESAFSESDAAT